MEGSPAEAQARGLEGGRKILDKTGPRENCGSSCRFAHCDAKPLVRNANLHTPLAHNDKTPQPGIPHAGGWGAAGALGWSGEAKTEEQAETKSDGEEEWIKIDEWRGGFWGTKIIFESKIMTEPAESEVSGQESESKHEKNLRQLGHVPPPPPPQMSQAAWALPQWFPAEAAKTRSYRKWWEW